MIKIDENRIIFKKKIVFWIAISPIILAMLFAARYLSLKIIFGLVPWMLFKQPWTAGILVFAFSIYVLYRMYTDKDQEDDKLKTTTKLMRGVYSQIDLEKEKELAEIERKAKEEIERIEASTETEKIQEDSGPFSDYNDEPEPVKQARKENLGKHSHADGYFSSPLSKTVKDSAKGKKVDQGSKKLKDLIESLGDFEVKSEIEEP